MTYILMNYNDYGIDTTELFHSKTKLKEYIVREYGDSLESNLKIDWEKELVFDKTDLDEPIAIFRKNTIR